MNDSGEKKFVEKNFGEKRERKRTQLKGCQIFLGTKYQNGKNIPNYHELYQFTTNYSECP
jgi:hypothetical protein